MLYSAAAAVRWKGSADAVPEERAGQAAGDHVGGLPAGAVSRNDHLGASCSRALTVSPMTCSKTGPARWKPPMTACRVCTPVRREA